MKKVEWALPILQKSQKANRINNLWMTKKYNFLCNEKSRATVFDLLPQAILR